MAAEPGTLLILWTARAMVVCYLARVIMDIYTRDALQFRVSRWIWTVGYGVFLLHLAAAFHFLHHWSHHHAVAHIAKRTGDVIGIYWGGGIWVNYAFALFWIGDLIHWWSRDDSRPISKTWTRTVHAVFAFMMVNATVVFGPRYWTWICAIVAAVLIVLWYFTSRNKMKTENCKTSAIQSK